MKRYDKNKIEVLQSIYYDRTLNSSRPGQDGNDLETFNLHAIKKKIWSHSSIHLTHCFSKYSFNSSKKIQLFLCQVFLSLAGEFSALQSNNKLCVLLLLFSFLLFCFVLFCFFSVFFFFLGSVQIILASLIILK